MPYTCTIGTMTILDTYASAPADPNNKLINFPHNRTPNGCLCPDGSVLLQLTRMGGIYENDQQVLTYMQDFGQPFWVRKVDGVWSAPYQIWSADKTQLVGSMGHPTVLPDGRLICFSRAGIYPQYQGCFFLSSDSGHTWTGPHTFTLDGLYGWIAEVYPSITVTDNGELLVGFYGCQQQGSNQYSMGPYSVGVISSVDGGDTWGFKSWIYLYGTDPIPTNGGQFDELNLIRLRDGRVAAFVRQDASNGQHAVWWSISPDGGATWPYPTQCSDINNQPFYTHAPVVRYFKNGVMAIVGRMLDGSGQMISGLRISEDDGQHWSGVTVLSTNRPPDAVGYTDLIVTDWDKAIATTTIADANGYSVSGAIDLSLNFPPVLSADATVNVVGTTILAADAIVNVVPITQDISISPLQLSLFMNRVTVSSGDMSAVDITMGTMMLYASLGSINLSSYIIGDISSDRGIQFIWQPMETQYRWGRYGDMEFYTGEEKPIGGTISADDPNEPFTVISAKCDYYDEGKSIISSGPASVIPIAGKNDKRIIKTIKASNTGIQTVVMTCVIQPDDASQPPQTRKFKEDIIVSSPI